MGWFFCVFFWPLKLGHSIKESMSYIQQIHTKIFYFCRINANKTLHMLQFYYMYLHGSFLGMQSFHIIQLPTLKTFAGMIWSRITVRIACAVPSHRNVFWKLLSTPNAVSIENGFGAFVGGHLSTAHNRANGVYLFHSK